MKIKYRYIILLLIFLLICSILGYFYLSSAILNIDVSLKYEEWNKNELLITRAKYENYLMLITYSIYTLISSVIMLWSYRFYSFHRNVNE